MNTLSLALAGFACVTAFGCRASESSAPTPSAVVSARLPEIRYYVIGDA